MSLKRLPVPQLKPKRIRKGAKNIVWRSFLTGKDNFLRCYSDNVEYISVKLQGITDQTIVAIHSDVSGSWDDILMERWDNGIFRASLGFISPGVFRFKIKYSLNNGESWFWDSAPYSYLYVDPAHLRKMKMYTLIPTISGSFGDWKNQLAGIKEMGFEFLHLLPVTQMGISESPYSASDLFDVDSSYLAPNDARSGLEQWEEFVEEAKRLGLRLCVDIVFNHVGIDSKVVSERPDWVASDGKEKDGNKRAGCWHNLEWVKWEDLALLEYDHPNAGVKSELWSYMKDYVLFWANYADYTGGQIRLDNLHSSERHFLTYLMKYLKIKFPHLGVLAELFTDQQTMGRMALEHNINLLMATPWVTSFADQLRPFFVHVHKSAKNHRYFIPVNSHDSGSVSQEYGGPSVTVARYAVCALFGTGATGITQGAEIGVPEKLPFIGRNPGYWGELEAESVCSFKDGFKAVNALIDKYDLFAQAGNLEFIDSDHPAVIAAYRKDNNVEDKGVSVFCNLDPHGHQEIEIPRDKFAKDFSQKVIWGEAQIVGEDPAQIKILLGPGAVLMSSI